MSIETRLPPLASGLSRRRRRPDRQFESTQPQTLSSQETPVSTLKDQVVLITGAAQGMGQATAEHLVNQGAIVIATDINEDKLGTAMEPLGVRASPVLLNVGSEADWARVVELAVQRFGRIDGLVNNAAIHVSGLIEDFAAETMRSILDTNLAGPWLGMKAVVPAMKRQRRGSIVNISSVEGLTARCGATVYGATKWGLRGMTKALAKEVGPFGVRVNCILPGAINTPMLQQGMQDTPFDARFPEVAMNRPGNPHEIAQSTAFLLSDSASYVSGTDLVIDGAWTCGIYSGNKPTADTAA
jgi:3alpha(or 20beta)-hydroxysteroid dehydrogenase